MDNWLKSCIFSSKHPGLQVAYLDSSDDGKQWSVLLCGNTPEEHEEAAPSSVEELYR